MRLTAIQDGDYLGAFIDQATTQTSSGWSGTWNIVRVPQMCTDDGQGAFTCLVAMRGPMKARVCRVPPRPCKPLPTWCLGRPPIGACKPAPVGCSGLVVCTQWVPEALL